MTDRLILAPSLERKASREVNPSSVVAVRLHVARGPHAHLWIWSPSRPLCRLNIHNSASNLKRLPMQGWQYSHQRSYNAQGCQEQNPKQVCSAAPEPTRSSFPSVPQIRLRIVNITAGGERAIMKSGKMWKFLCLRAAARFNSRPLASALHLGMRPICLAAHASIKFKLS